MSREHRAKSNIVMKIHNKIIKSCIVALCALPFTHCYSANAETIFSDDAGIVDNLPVSVLSDTFADIYEKLDSVKFAGKNINIAIESLQKIHPSAHISATDRRIILVWGDTIVANYPRPAVGDWREFGEITTAVLLKMRENDVNLHRASESELYAMAVSALLSGVDENGRYIYSQDAEIAEDGRLLTSIGLTGERDERGNFRVNGIFKGTSADIAGVRMGDIISGINGKSVASMSPDELDAAISGFNSGTVKMHLLTPFGNRDVVLRRATIVATDADIIYRNGDNANILEIIIHNVSNGAVSIVNEALAQHTDINGIILDLRSAGGDDTIAAAKLAGLFIGQNPVMRVVQVNHEEMEIVPGGDAVTDAHVVVLLSGNTRGTAEAIASAFYENNRGILIGTPTAGAARIASTLELKNGGALEVWDKSLKSGSGDVLDGRGVFPIVCLSNIRSAAQQHAFFLNVVNRDFIATDFNRRDDIDVAEIRRGCPSITSGADEDALATAVSAQLLTDDAAYKRLMINQN